MLLDSRSILKFAIITLIDAEQIIIVLSLVKIS